MRGDRRGSTPAVFTCCSSAQYIVGTPVQKPTCSRSIVSSTAAGSKRGSSTIRMPCSSPAFIWQVCAVEWNSGSVTSTTSCAMPPRIAGRNMSRVATAFSSMFAWVSSAPFGWPVVPEV